MSYGKQITPEQVAEWRGMYEDGMSGPQIAAFCGRSATTITRALRRHGLAMRPSASALKRGKVRAPVSWLEGWCDDCCEIKPLHPKTGWCAECTIQNHPNRLTAKSRIGPGRVNGPALVATSTREATMHHHTPTIAARGEATA